MALTKKDLNTLFVSFPDPVLLLTDGQLAFCNPAATEQLRLRAGMPAPDWLQLPQSGTAAFRRNERDYTAALSQAAGGTLCICRREAEPAGEREHRRVAVLTGQLRRHMAALTAAREHLRETGAEKWSAMGLQSEYRILRLLEGAELELTLERSEPLRLDLLDLAGLCRDLSHIVEGLAEQSGRKFSALLHTDMLLTAGSDELLTRLLLILLSNAMKAAGPGGAFGLELQKENDRACLTVWDSGSAPVDLAQLFRAEAEPSMLPADGLGVGLLNARRIVELHGGAILAESRPEGGLCVRVSLPIRHPEVLTVRSPYEDDRSGYPAVLTELSESLPWQVFLEEI